MTAIKKLIDGNGNQYFPQTHTNAVIDDNGYSVESRMQAVQDVVNQAQMAIGAVPSDLTPTEDSTNWVTSGGVYNALQNIQNDVTELDLAVNGAPSRDPVTLTKTDTTWAAGLANYTTGAKGTSSVNNISGYIDVSGATSVELTVNGSTSTAADLYPGTCFYDESKAFIRGYQCATGLPETQIAVRTYDVPSNAKYMRCTIHNNYIDNYYCTISYEGTVGLAEIVATNTSDIDSLKEDVDSFKPAINGTQNSTSTINDVTWTSGHVARSSGAVSSSTINRYSNYIDVAGASRVNITVNKTTTVSGYSPGTCFYNANKVFIVGYSPYIAQAESGYAQKDFPVPPNAAYMRTSLGNDYPFTGTIYYEGEIGLVNILSKDITSQFTEWYTGQIVASMGDRYYGQRYESDTSRVSSDYISCEGAYKLDITFLTSASSTTAGLCFYTSKSTGSVINSKVAKVTGVNGIERSRLTVPSDAKYFRTTIPATEDTSNFVCRLVYKDVESFLENTTSASVVKDENPYIGHPSIYISEPTASVSTILNSKTVTELYAEYDALVTSYPHFISRGTDICTVTDDTSSYDIRQYIIGFQDQGAISSEPGVTDTTFTNIWSSADNPKKILINAGMHGEEKAPCWGTMLAFKELLESNDDWALFIKSNFILKIIPCLNPYGFDRNSRNNIYGHDLNRNTSIGDADRVAYINWVGENSDALAVIDSHGTQGKYAYVPNAYYMKNHNIVTRVTEKLAAAFMPTFSALWGSINESYVSTFYPFLLAKYDPTATTPNLAGCAGEMFSNYGMEEFAIETPCNLSNGSRSQSDLRSCQITKMLLLNFIQVVGCYY